MTLAYFLVSSGFPVGNYAAVTVIRNTGGCCEGSAPMCLRRSDFRPGAQDVLLGEIEGCPFYVGAAQYAYWAPYQIVVDVTDGGGDSFSLEAADGVRFTVLSRPLTVAETVDY